MTEGTGALKPEHRRLYVVTASVGLGIVLYEFEMVVVAQLPYLLGVCATAVEMDEEDGSCAFCYRCLNL